MKKLMNRLAVFLLTFLLGTFAATASVHAAPPANFQVNQVIGTGLNGPSGFEIAPDGRIFVLERTGKIKVVKNGQLLATPFADLPSVASGDRGLIGIAFDPEFGIANHYVYFYYTGTDLLNRLVRFDASTDVGQDGPFLLYKTNSPSQELHVGGSIRFGPDGKLYFAVGDNGYPPNAQNLGNPHGKILRINKDGSIPLDNPFYGQPGALPEIWAYGMRNPWRFQFDSATGELYGGDVGDYTWEEVNHIRKGQNYGWPNFEGYCNALCGATTTPIYAYNHNGNSAAVTGGPIYRGNMFPDEYKGSLFFGDYAMGFIKRAVLDANGNASSIQDFDLNAGSVVDLKVASDGSLYYITYFPGRLYRVSYTTGNHSPTANATADVNKGVEPLTVHFSSAGSSDPDGTALTYLWNFGDGTTSTAANPVKTYTVKGTYTVELSVSDGVNTGNAVPVVIQVGIPPTVNIGEPADGSNYRAGDVIHWTASSLDGAGFDINDNNLKTEIILHHHTHIHPFLGPITGRQGTFTTPTSGEASADTWFEIKVTATDENGLSTTKSNFIYPLKSTMTFASNIPGLTFYLDGAPHTTPFTVEGVERFQREISAPAMQFFNGKNYQFEGWSDGGAPKHTIITPQDDTTYTAVFSEAPAYNAQYFNNTDLSGTPVLTRQDAKIDFVWGEGSPATGINTDNFSVRWIKNQYFAAGRYKFTTATDDGVRLFIDGKPVIDEWHGNNASFNATVDLTAGNHEIRMEFLELFGLANARLEYDFTQDQTTPPLAAGFVGEYFNNKTLTGNPILTRNETSINFDWGGGSPDPVVPNDNFSARWTKTEALPAGEYTFTATADDGVRVKVDGEVIIDKFIDQGPTTYTATKLLTAGNHTIIMEYYEATGGALAKLSYVKTADAPATGFTGEYFNNKTLAGTPVLTRNDAVVSFNWGNTSPDPLIAPDNFSARWTKTETITAANAGTYQFTATADDGVRVKVDGVLVIDKWIDQGATTYTANKDLAAGNHTIVMEYYENTGGATAALNYTKIGGTPPPTGSFTGEYFVNKTLTGTPILTRNDAAVNFDWGGGSPDPVVPNDNFSARWTKTETFAAGTYEFSVTGDDGIRLKIDGVTVIDKFIDQAPTTYKVIKDMTAGDHTIVVEYFETGGGAVAKFSYVATNTPPPPPTEAYQAEYFNNKTLTAPVTVTRTDAAIDFDWGGGSPDPLINANNFSARWTKTTTFEAGNYKFSVTGDDGIRLKVDGEVLIDQFHDQSPTTYTVDKTLTAGNHTIVVEYFETGGGAVAKMSYVKLDGTPPPTENYVAKYWNIGTSGAPAIPLTQPNLTQNETDIDHDWKGMSPAAVINNDRFVAQWTKTHTFEAATYTFTTTSDDGIRVYIDDTLVIDKWIDQSSATHTGEKTLTAGDHVIRVEYFESFGDAVAKFSFEKKAGTPPPPTDPNKFSVDFFNNMTLTGTPVLTKLYDTINFNLGQAAPDPLVNPDHFSVRATKTQQFTAGTYSFTLSSDDGIRFWVDDQLLVDDWTDHGTKVYNPTVTLTEGQHTLKIEYYENGWDAVLTFLQN